MNTFALQLLDATHAENFPALESFVAADSSGSFGILAGHAPLLTVLRTGLASFRLTGGARRYLALPGGVLRFVGDRLTLGTRYYLMADDPHGLGDELQARVAEDERNVGALRRSLRSMEEELLLRLWRLDRQWRAMS